MISKLVKMQTIMLKDKFNLVAFYNKSIFNEYNLFLLKKTKICLLFT